jgi:hypothetical protein
LRRCCRSPQEIQALTSCKWMAPACNAFHENDTPTATRLNTWAFTMSVRHSVS